MSRILQNIYCTVPLMHTFLMVLPQWEATGASVNSGSGWGQTRCTDALRHSANECQLIFENSGALKGEHSPSKTIGVSYHEKCTRQCLFFLSSPSCSSAFSSFSTSFFIQLLIILFSWPLPFEARPPSSFYSSTSPHPFLVWLTLEWRYIRNALPNTSSSKPPFILQD